MHQYVGIPNGETIHSSIQLENFDNLVDEKPHKVNDKGQIIETPDGYKFPLRILHGLPYMDLRSFSDAEWTSLPHVALTSDEVWDQRPRQFSSLLPQESASALFD